MDDSNEVARLRAEVLKWKAIAEMYERHVSVEVRKSIDRTLQRQKVPLSPSQCQQNPSSMLEEQVTSGESVLTATGNASGLHRGGFQIIEFDLSSVQKPLDHRPSKNKPKPGWKSAVDSFLADVPSAQEWNTRVQELSVDISGFTGQSIQQTFKPQAYAESTIFDRAKHHVQQATGFITKASQSLARARMYLLCVLSYFCVLDTMDLVRRACIYELMSELLGDCAGKTNQYKKRIWDSARWMNKDLMRGLVEAGWTRPQVTTLFLFCTCFPYSHLTMTCSHQR
jgi:hypothetical protein